VRTYCKRNGKKKFKKRQYQTDLLARNAVQFINTTPADKPLFLYLAPSAPHAPAIPADRHRRAATTRGGAPRVPSFDAGDMSHKRVKAADSLYVKQLRAMFAVEDMIADVIDALREQNRLDNTYLFFASDNGLHHGEHGIVNNKNTPFEESIRTPLIVLGPGVPAGQTTEAMASLIDLGPTFAALAGVAAPDFVDGRSLKPVLQSGNTPVGWRTTVLSELLRGPKKGLTALRTGPHAYVAYGDGDRELYDLEHDPYELDQLYETAPSSLKDDLEAQYQALHDCGAEGGEPTTCQDADGGG
jgi:arylsulfatase A-like enzyme